MILDDSTLSDPAARGRLRLVGIARDVARAGAMLLLAWLAYRPGVEFAEAMLGMGIFAAVGLLVIGTSWVVGSLRLGGWGQLTLLRGSVENGAIHVDAVEGRWREVVPHHRRRAEGAVLAWPWSCGTGVVLAVLTAVAVVVDARVATVYLGVAAIWFLVYLAERGHRRRRLHRLRVVEEILEIRAAGVAQRVDAG